MAPISIVVVAISLAVACCCLAVAAISLTEVLTRELEACTSADQRRELVGHAVEAECQRVELVLALQMQALGEVADAHQSRPSP